MHRIILILTLILVLLNSCRKDSDERAPQISILNPAEFSNFDIGEEIIIQIQVSDDQNLEYVRVDITNASQSRVAGPSEYTNFSGTSDSRSIGINVTNSQLPSGIYFIRAVVGDGENERVVFREISLSEIPLKLNRIYAFRALGPNSTTVDSLNRQSNNWVSSASVGIGLGKVTVNSASNEIQFLSADGAELELRDGLVMDLIQSHSYPSGGFSNPYWRVVTLNENTQRYYCASSDGKIRTYRAGGIPDLTIETGINSIPSSLGIVNEYLLLEQEVAGPGLDLITTYFTESGTYLQSDVIEADLIQILQFTSNKALLFGNLEDGTGKVWIFDILANGYSSALSLSSYSNIRTAIKANGNQYILADEMGIRKFELSSGGTLNNGGQLLAGDYTQLQYDKLGGGIYALNAGTGQIDIVNPFDLTIIESILLPSNTQNFGLLYNR